MSSELYVTTDKNLAAALMVATGAPPDSIRPGVAMVEYVFRATEVVQAVVARYAGHLHQDVRRYASHRRWLDVRAEEVAQTGKIWGARRG